MIISKNMFASFYIFNFKRNSFITFKPFIKNAMVLNSLSLA